MNSISLADNFTLFSKSVLRTSTERTSANSQVSEYNEEAAFNRMCALTSVQRFNSKKTYPVIDLAKTRNIANATKISTPTRWIEFQGKYRVHRFPQQTILPKVQLTNKANRGQVPRNVEVDRRRKKYARINLENELLRFDIKDGELYPANDQFELLSENALDHFLPISYFDDTRYDCNSPEAWLRLGVVDYKIYHIPIRAFLPIKKSLFRYSWQLAAAMKYDASKDMWTIRTIWEEEVFEVPRIQIMFLAEDPLNFVRRIRTAVTRRNQAENMVRFHIVVDAILYGDLRNNTITFVRQKKIDSLLQKVICKPAIWWKIHDEIYLVFEHLMACYEFLKFVKLRPKEFVQYNDVTLKDVVPVRYPSVLPEDVLEYFKTLHVDITDISFKVLQTTCYYNKAAIEAMAHNHKECSFLETQNLFVTNLAKAVTLPDFLQVQLQNSNHVVTYLKSFWPSKIASGIILVLRQLGRGWLDIRITDWTVYQLCKISRFIHQVKLRMEESMQDLLETSMHTFIDFVTDPCKQFLDVPSKFVWTNNYIDSHFPWDKPIFFLNIGVSEHGRVVYSTAPEEFEPALQDCFKATLERTNGVKCVDAEIMTNLRFAPNLFICTVELIENLYIEMSNYLGRCYKQAVYPLNAYAKLFEHFIPFCLLNVNEYMLEYERTRKPSAEVKADILDHKKQKEDLRANLPDQINIGPFCINVEYVKSFMIKKHTEINKRIFEYYIDRMLEVNTEILANCVNMFTKIDTSPYSIENLYDIRDYANLVPQLVEDLKSEIQVMVLEYDVLDFFFYNLSDSQFEMKWDAIAWPYKILTRLATLRDEQKEDIDNFMRTHMVEIQDYEMKLESLNDEVQNYSLYFDPAKVAEVAVEVKLTWNNIEKLKEEGETLKKRQELYDLGEFSFEFLNSIMSAFAPYRNLWTAGADLKKLEEATVGNPMSMIDLESVERSLLEIRQQLQQTFMNFRDKPEIQAVAKTFLHGVDKFVPIYQCIKAMTSEFFLVYHWQELATRSGLDIKFSPTINFQGLIRKGIMNFTDLIKEIAERAELEAEELQKALAEEERRKEEEMRLLMAYKLNRKCRRDIL